MTTYKQTLKTTKSSTPKSLDLSFIGPMLPKVEPKKVEPKKVESKKVESDKEVIEKKRIIKVSPSDQYVMENRSYLDLIKEYESMAKINVEVIEKKRIIKVSPSDQYVMENRSYLDLIKEYESMAKINVEVKAKKRIVNKPIFCYVDGQPYNSLCDALRQHNISLDKKTSPWFKINRELKKHGEYQYESLKFSLK